jgi:ABC-2 type transport system permease protein/sodium transport system permease protein
VAARIFGNDALLSASRGSWSELLQRPASVRQRPQTVAALFCLLVMFPIYFLLGNAALSQSEAISGRLVLNALVTITVFVLCPLAFAIAGRVSLRGGFGLQGAPLVAFLGAALLGLGLWPFAHYLFLFGAKIGLATLDQSQFAAAERMLKGLSSIPLPLILLTLAVVPAVCEEFFFRGFLFQSLRERLSGWGVILTTSLLFGLFHVATPSVLSPERFLPSTFMGLALGWVCWRSGSVLPGMLLHTFHNGLLLTLLFYRDTIIARGWGVFDELHLPWWWLVAGIGLVLLGAALVFLSTTSGFRRFAKSPAGTVGPASP